MGLLTSAYSTRLTPLQGSQLDGHALVLQLSHKKTSVKEGASKNEPKKSKASSTKIIVRNVVSTHSCTKCTDAVDST
jgi:hypothetical protein